MATQTTPRAESRERKGKTGLEALGLAPKGTIHWNLVAPELVQAAVRRDEGQLADKGPFVGITTPHTGRSPKDKFLVKEPGTERDVWWGDVNRPFSPENYHKLLTDVRAYLAAQPELFVQDLWTGADPRHRLSVRYVSPNAWQMLFVRNMFIRPELSDLPTFVPNFSVLHAPEMQADPAKHGTRSGTFIVLDFASRQILIGGTRYAGELKKAMFTVMNYLMPKSNVLSMHCSANIGEHGDCALFFGLSGTGKTTLSADPERQLIGDDEHGWSDEGVFNFEGGCYAKTIRIRKASEPEIYAATESFGTILENVAYDPRTRVPDYDSDEKTENTRAAYPVDLIPNAVLAGTGGHPSNVIFLSADAYGVLPPVARLDHDQIRHYFLSGYTSKVAGTERGVTEPEPVFSTCFAAPFLVLPPERYAEMLIERVKRHHAEVWMLNTGWVGGPYGVGERMSIAHTRAIVHAILQGKLRGASTHVEPVFGLHIPDQVPDVPREVLDPRGSWADPAAYDRQALRLREMFEKNISMIGKSASTAG